MITKEQLETIAHIVSESLEITRNDHVLIGGGEHAHKLFDRIRIEAMKKGANQCVHALSDDYGRELFDASMPLCAVEKTPLYFLTGKS